MRFLPGAAVLAAAALTAAGCGGDDERRPRVATAGTATTTPAGPRGAACEMTAAAAQRVADLLASGAPQRGRTTLFLHRETSDATDDNLDRTDVSPDPRRDVFVLVNPDQDAVLGLRGRSGGHVVELQAARGCGAVGSVRHAGPARASFTADGRRAGSVRAGG